MASFYCLYSKVIERRLLCFHVVDERIFIELLCSGVSVLIKVSSSGSASQEAET